MLMKAAAFLCALFLCAALLFTAVYTAAVDPDVYARHQARLGVAERSGFSQEELTALDSAVAAFMRGEGELSESLFSQRERLHMQDVRALVSLCSRLMAAAWLLFAAGVVFVVARLRRSAARVLLRGGAWAMGATALAAGALVLWAVRDFQGLFTAFHQALFTNDLWLLSASSTLIRMFPEDFFLAMAMEIGIRFAVMLIAFAAMGKGLIRYADTRG